MQAIQAILRSRMWRLPISLTLLFMMVLGGLTVGLRNTTGNYCLLYAPHKGRNAYGILYDLRSGEKADALTSQPEDSTPAYPLANRLIQTGINYGVSGYSLDRQSLKHLYLRDSIDHAGKVFYSADQEAALIAGMRNNKVVLQLTKVDGRTELVLTSIPSVPDEVVWSSDMTLVAIAHTAMVEVFETISGKKIMSKPMGWSRKGLSFSNCKEFHIR
jgi:hypothetical protein